jgi:hypothetical protein
MVSKMRITTRKHPLSKAYAHFVRKMFASSVNYAHTSILVAIAA